MRSNSEFRMNRQQTMSRNPSRGEIQIEMSRISSTWSADERRRRRHMAQVSQWLLMLPSGDLLAG